MTVSPIDRQSLLDVSLQHTGIAENVYDIAMQNGISITDEVHDAIDISVSATDARVVDYLQNSGTVPATEIYSEPGPVPEPDPELGVSGPTDIYQPGDYEFAFEINPDYPYAYEIRWMIESDDLNVIDMGGYFAAYDANNVLSVELFDEMLYVYQVGNWTLQLLVQCVVNESVADEVLYTLYIHL